MISILHNEFAITLYLFKAHDVNDRGLIPLGFEDTGERYFSWFLEDSFISVRPRDKCLYLQLFQLLLKEEKIVVHLFPSE